MTWKDQCMNALLSADLFQNAKHQSRFKELIDCYFTYPFFTKGLCKCMYLSSWDDEHFYIMLENLAEMSIGKEKNTQEMSDRGTVLANEQTDSQYYVYLLSCTFLDGTAFHLDEKVHLEPEIQYIISQALKASEIIDNL